MKSFRRILQFAKSYRISIALNILFNLLSIVFALMSIGLIILLLRVIFGNIDQVSEVPTMDVGLIQYIQDFLAYELGRRISNAGQADALLYVCFWVVGTFFFKNLFNYLALYSIATLRNGVTRDIRLALHQKILGLPLSFFTEQRKGDIISRMTNDLKEIEWSILMTIESFFREPIMIAGSLGILIWINPVLTAFVLVLLPVVSLIVTSIGRSLKQSSSKAQKKMGELMSKTEENISGLKVIKAFNAEDQKKRLFQQIVDSYFHLMNSVMRKNDLASPLSEFLGTAVMAIVIWYGGSLVLENNDFGAEEFITYVLFFYQIIPPAKALSKVSYHIQRGNASSERVLEILDANNPIKNKKGALDIKEFTKEIRFENVSFSYNEKRVLNQINLTIPKGKVIALVGHSGGGKTTLTNLVPRFYNVNVGKLNIDNMEIKDLRIDSLRALMGVVTQESILFNESVFYNIALGKPGASWNEVIQAAKIANAHGFIEKMEKGYKTNIGDGGNKLSGGQQQRISIARGVLKNPPILILDEATSALDTESERLVQDALYKLMRNRTSLVIAHRLSTIQNADEIIVMQNGSIAERGTHAGLLEKGSIYYGLVEMQKFS